MATMGHVTNRLDLAAALNLEPTRRLHQTLVAQWHERPAAMVEACARANHVVQENHVQFERRRSIQAAVSALLLDARGEELLRSIGEQMFAIVEQALDFVLADERRLTRWFADHRRIYPFLAKTRGLDSWQGYSRFDAVVTPAGEIKIIELNTGCAAGLTIAEPFSLGAIESLEMLGFQLPQTGLGTVRPTALVEHLLEVEQTADLGNDLIVVANDENGLLQELDAIAEQFRQQGRNVVVANAAELEYRDAPAAAGPADRSSNNQGRLFYRDQPVSLTYNKMRISTRHSPAHHWRPEFESRYAGFLAGTQSGACASVNNLAAMTIAEDKGLLAVLFEPEVFAEFSEDDQAFLHRHVARTSRLADYDRSVSAGRLSRERSDLVVKPANEGRGLEVHLGKECSADDWRRLTDDAEPMPRVMQEYIEPATLPVVRGQDATPSVENCNLTIGLAVMRGRYEGIVSRISTESVTNVARRGMIQGVLVGDFQFE